MGDVALIIHQRSEKGATLLFVKEGGSYHHVYPKEQLKWPIFKYLSRALGGTNSSSTRARVFVEYNMSF